MARGRTLSILPPGENGLVNAEQLAAFNAGGTRPPGSDDQLGKYAALIYGAGAITDKKLGQYFLEESFGVRRQEVTRVEHPSPHVGVTILRDTHRVPHVYGRSMDAMAFGAGYAAGEDRLFFMDVVRHYAHGDLAGFLGSSCSFEQMDHDQLLISGYSEDQLKTQLALLPKRFGGLGKQLVSMIRSYVDGVNAYIAQARADPTKLPVDYEATRDGPQPWRDTDVVAITSLITTQATGGGIELRNAALLRYLEHTMGNAAGDAAFVDLKEQNDPAAPTTIGRGFPYMIPGKINPALTAIPDDPAAPLAGGPVDTTPGCRGATAASAVAAASSSMGYRSPSDRALSQGIADRVATVVASLAHTRGVESNAMVIDGGHSVDGHPIGVFGPEVGYYTPQVLMIEDLHAPGYDAAGAAFPGANLVVQLGRGRSYAWSATSASTDQIDQRIERICDPSGGHPASNGHFYVFKGACLPMGHLAFSETLPSASGSTPAGTVLTHEIFTTIHGIVQGWTTVGGAPVAVAGQRSTFMHDVDSLAGFLSWGMPSRSSEPTSWMKGAADIAYSFNWFYVNGRHIAYYVSGRDPIRPPDVDPNLPTWGVGSTEWSGYLPSSSHPHAVDPPQGSFTSWNNKPAPRFSASDDTYAWGPVFRSQLFDFQLQRELASHHRLSRSQVVQATAEASTMDLSGFVVVPELNRYLGKLTDPRAQALLDRVVPWSAQGAHRVKTDAAATQYRDAAAVAIWDEAYPRVVQALFSPIFAAGGLSTYDGLPTGFDVVPMGFENTPNNLGMHSGDGYYGGWGGYVLKALRQLDGSHVDQPFSSAIMSRLCGPHGPSDCSAALLAALDSTYDAMVQANHSTNTEAWTQNTATVTASRAASSTINMAQYDNIQFQAVGIVGQPNIDWQNRPTFQQVAEFPG